jgi:hypothetical protein
VAPASSMPILPSSPMTRRSLGSTYGQLGAGGGGGGADLAIA